jgi:Na+-translocating ferredoxin:NAD+ oxidoreductase RnfD subunit
MLIGFQSDLGYFAMALILASLAVVAVSQFQWFAYFAMLVAVSLLARVDNLIAGFKDALAFVWLSGLALLGLALSWLPVLLQSAVHDLHP